MDGELRLDGKSAVVVGAAQGIGRAIALCFAGAGAHVLCADINEVGAKATAAEAEKNGGKAAAARVDVTRSADAQALAARAVEVFGGLDVLLFGAATHDASATVPELEESVWDQVLRVNLTGAYLVSKACLPVMIKGGGGSIILIASQLGRVASPGRAAYCTTKGGLIQLAKVMATDQPRRVYALTRSRPGQWRPTGSCAAGAIWTRRARSWRRSTSWGAWASRMKSRARLCSSRARPRAS